MRRAVFLNSGLFALTLLASSVSASPSCIANLDLDLDGRPDIVESESASGLLRIVAADRSAVIRQFVGLQAGDHFGAGFVVIPDVTGDGRPDLVVSAPAYSNGTGPRGALHLLNPHAATGVWTRFALGTDALLTRVFVVPDQDEDGKSDVVIGLGPTPSSRSLLVSGASGEVLITIDCRAEAVAQRGCGGSVLYLRTDLDGSHRVDQADLVLFGQLFAGGDPRVDFDRNGILDGADAARLSADITAGRTTAVLSPGFCPPLAGTTTGRTVVIPDPPLDPIVGVVASGCPCTLAACPTQPPQPPGGSGGPRSDPPATPRPFLRVECPPDPFECEPRKGWARVVIENYTAGPVNLCAKTDPQLWIKVGGALNTGVFGQGCASGSITLHRDETSDFKPYFYVEISDPLGVTPDCPEGGGGSFTVALIDQQGAVFNEETDCFYASCNIRWRSCPATHGQVRELDLDASGTPADPLPVVADTLGTLAYLLDSGGLPTGQLTWTVEEGDEYKVELLGSNGGQIHYLPKSFSSGSTTATIHAEYRVPDCPPRRETIVIDIQPDTDQDGLADGFETGCLNPNNPDSDGDGSPDGLERRLGSNPCDAASEPDPMGDADRDGLTDVEEVLITRTSRHSFDTDADGAQDYAEVTLSRFDAQYRAVFALHWYGQSDPLNPRSLQPSELDGYNTNYRRFFDRDSDQLFDPFEEMMGFDTLNRDQNSNGLPDGIEMSPLFGFGTGIGDPWTAIQQSSQADSDGDGLTDVSELVLGTDPLNYDSDDDGLGDGFELLAGTSPRSADTNGDGVSDSFDDPDGDGLDNYGESVYGTNPFLGDSDGDGTSDAAEIAHNGLPNDPTDGGEPLPSDERCDVTISVGDESPSQSEKWALRVGTITHRAREYGGLFTTTYVFKRGTSHTFSLQHHGTRADFGACDPDYTAAITADCMSIIVDDPNGPILFNQYGSQGDDPCNPRAGMTGKLYLPIVKAYDLRDWGPTQVNGETTIENTDLKMPRTPADVVAGVVADGATALVLRLETDDAIIAEEALQALQTSGQALKIAVGSPNQHSGGLWAVSSPFIMSPLPIEDEPLAQGYSQTVPFEQGVALYVPPITFSGPQTASNVPLVFTAFVEGPPPQPASGSLTLGLYRPPLVLVHGIWVADMQPPSSTWGDPNVAGAAWSESTATPISTRIYYAGYADTSLEGYSENAVAVYETIQRALNDYRNGIDYTTAWTPASPLLKIGPHTWVQSPSTVTLQKKRIAVSRVDVVGHSMGGQVTRWYMGDMTAVAGYPLRLRGPAPGGWSNLHPNPVAPLAMNKPACRRADNWFVGDIAHLVTIGSPFQGSLWANGIESLVDRTSAEYWELAVNERVTDGYLPLSLERRLFRRRGSSWEYLPPTGVADLCVGSSAWQAMTDAATVYPVVRWVPVATSALPVPPGQQPMGVTDCLNDLAAPYQQDAALYATRLPFPYNIVAVATTLTLPQILIDAAVSNVGVTGLNTGNSDMVVAIGSQANGNLLLPVITGIQAPHITMPALPSVPVWPTRQPQNVSISTEIGRWLSRNTSGQSWRNEGDLK